MECIKSHFYLALFLGFIPLSLQGQITFDDQSSKLFDKDSYSGVPIAIADMNGDGLDDIVVLNQTNELRIQYQSPDRGRGFIRYKSKVVLENSDQNDICIGDFNNDGYNDILAVGFYDRIKLLTAIPGTTEFDLKYIVVPEFYSQGASAGDFNHDGWLDAIFLNDNGYNVCMLNDGTGNLVQTDYIDFHTVPVSDNSGNYGCVYTDFDMDGDVDFYIAKCRQGVNNPADPRRINALFVNDGNGNYTEAAKEYGLASGRQSWTADFGDFDNDGDMDVFITQHDVICELFENIDNDTFINITTQAGLSIGGIPLQGMFVDFDNDGYMDILVSGDRVDLYRNNGDKTFTLVDPFGNKVFGTFGLGDFNHDGKVDIYGSTVEPFNNPHPFRPDYLFINTSDGIIPHHHLSVSLKQKDENTSAIGAMALLYGEWGIQIREVRGGEQYGVSNAHTLYFGLGLATTMDSLVIRWPDGSRDNYGALTVDKHYFITKGNCISQRAEVWNDLYVICGDDSLIFKKPEGVIDFTWSNGETGDSLVIYNPGIYFGTIHENGCDQLYASFEVIKDPDTEKPYILYGGETDLCENETPVLTLPNGFGFEWNTGETTQFIQPKTSGEYFATITGYCTDLLTDTISLTFHPSGIYETFPDTVTWGETATLVAHGDSIHWYSDPIAQIIVGIGDTIQIPDVTQTTSLFARSVVQIDGQSGSVGQANHQGNTFYNGNTINGGLLFEVHQSLVIDSITVYTEFPGVRIFEIFDSFGDLIFQKEYELVDGKTVVPFEFAIPEGSYRITTNTDQNISLLGTANPFLFRSNEFVMFPYTFKNAISITTSTFGDEFYYYFYDWKVSEMPRFCRSNFVEVEAYLDLSSSTGYPESLRDVSVTPNPANDWIQISGEALRQLDEVQIFNSIGQLVYTDRSRDINGVINVQSWAEGQYFIRVQNAEGVRIFSFMKS